MTKKHFSWKRGFVLLSILSACLLSQAAETFVGFASGDWLLNPSSTIGVYVDNGDLKGVSHAAKNLCEDLRRVCGVTASISNDATARIVAGTIGHSQAVDQLVKKGLLNGKELKGKREKYLIQVTGDQLVIAGSDRRGTIFGIYELSRQLGVSPWYYWADIPVEPHAKVYINKGVFTDGEPAVRYRGLFLNDEAPCLTSWVKNTFHTDYGGHDFYEKVFELILRLKGNFLWPAMWGWAFYADDPQNSILADEMGIIIGTSHHEPMARNHQEWARHRNEYGPWNYEKNQTVIDRFFREGIERMKDTEDIVTIGMRGDGDEAMSEDADTRLLQKIVQNQRRIIREVTGKKAEKTPQVWALYKEVLDYYDKGMKVPDDVLMLLCDDNWGNVRRVPNAEERKHPGGWGLYYHVDYVGAPRNSKWLNVTPTQNMWEQLRLAYDHGIDRMWILNVGDLKPMEYPIAFFMDMAWNPDICDAATVINHTQAFCREQFGAEQAEEAARILNRCCKLNGRSTAEMLNHRTYNLETGEWQRVVTEYKELENEALRQYITLNDNQRDAYRELILFPVQAMANLHEMYFAQAMNLNLAAKGDDAANLWADRVERTFQRDSLLCAQYNKEIAGGKWDGMMTQKHIGYRSWNDNFEKDLMPATKRLNGNDESGGYEFSSENGFVAIEAEHFYAKSETGTTRWTVIPDMGRTLSGIALMPYTQEVDSKNTWLEYRFRMTSMPEDSIKVHVVVKSTLDFLNQGGLRYRVILDDSEPITVNFNSRLNERPENIYSIYYPTVARRVVESVITMPVNRQSGDVHKLVIMPCDPGIVFEKVVIDGGGYSPSFLFGEESAKKKVVSKE